MRVGDFTEKREFKRLDLSLPTRIKRELESGKEEMMEASTINISFSGAYLEPSEKKEIRPKEILQISISIPREDTRDFPFSRLSGEARVVRVEKDGVAIEFHEDISRLFIAE